MKNFYPKGNAIWHKILCNLIFICSLCPLTAHSTPLFPPTTAKAAYLRSTFGTPWGNNTNEVAMDEVFGTGNWSDLRYETVDIDTLLANHTAIYLEGSDNNNDQLESFLTAHLSRLEDWVSLGNKLFINAAPNSGDGMDLGFGNTTLIYPFHSSFVYAVNSTHPIFNGPHLPIGDSWSGSSFGHAQVIGNELIPLIENDGINVLVEKNWGIGTVLFGGMTTYNYHTPNEEAKNLRKNILEYLKYQPVSVDAGIIAIDSNTVLCEGIKPIEVTVGNRGLDSITNLTINWRVNGILQSPYTFNGIIPPFGSNENSVQVSLGSINIQLGQTYQIVVWTSNPNGMIDSIPQNDTLQMAVSGGLSGTFTIGGASPDFIDFTAAVTALTNYGVCGPTVFKVRNGTYNEQVSVGVITGVSPSNTVLFESEMEDSSLVVLTYNSSLSYQNYTLLLDGADYVTFQKMTIEASNPSYGCAVEIGEDSDHNSLVNNVLSSPVAATFSSGNAVIYSNPFTSNNNKITGNLIRGGAYGIRVDAWNTSSCREWRINNNQFENQYAYGIYLYLLKDTKIDGNKIFITTTLTYATGIYLEQCTENTVLTANTIIDKSGNSYGIQCFSLNGTALKPAIISNNFVVTKGTEIRNAVYIQTSNYVNFVHNTIVSSNNNIFSALLYVVSGGNFTNLNNIFNSKGDNRLIQFDGLSNAKSDFNNYYSTSPNFGYYNGGVRSSLATWRILSMLDSNSISVDPQFEADLSYEAHAIDLNGTAKPSPLVLFDIENTPRSSSMPDIGAKEFVPASLDASILPSPKFEAPYLTGTNNAYVILKNNGTTTLNSVQINLQLNENAPQVALNWTGTLESGDTTTVNIGNVTLAPGTSNDLIIWTALPNGMTDQFRKNDTIILDSLYGGLSGVYTIGGTLPDFSTFNAAINAMKLGGVVGPVTFNVRNGIYNEQLFIPRILGADSLRQIVFQSESGDSSLVTLRFSANSSANHTVWLYNTGWITFHKLTVEALNSIYGRVFVIEQGTHHLTLTNNLIKGISTTSSSSDLMTIYAWGNLQNSYLNINNNRILDGSYAFYYFGPGEFVPGIILRENSIQTRAANGILLGYCNRPIIDKNTITNTSYHYNFTGINIIYSSNGYELSNNTINSPSDGYGVIAYSFSTATDTTLIYNNYISMGSGANTAYGLYIANTSNLHLFHNTIKIRAVPSLGAAVLIDYLKDAKIQNNIFVNLSDGIAADIDDYFTPIAFDFNNYFSKGQQLIKSGSNTYASLADWQTNTTYDQHSLNLNPFFSGTSFQVAQSAFNNAGTPTPITQDIEGDLRNASTPDIGADEFEPAALDAGIVQIITPAKPFVSGLSPVQVVIKNYSTDSLSSATIYWTLNGALQDPINWTGGLSAEQTDSISLGPVNFPPGQATNIIAWTALPNNTNDAFIVNDTTKLLNIYAALGGTYTIGGAAPHFLNFRQAVQALHSGGVIAPVVFNVRNGTYTEQVSINSINGVDSINTVTFQSELGDSTQVVLQFSATNSAENHTIRLNGADWFTFRKMTLKSLSFSYGKVIELKEGSSKNIIEHNIIVGPVIGFSSENMALLFSPETIDNGNIIRDNRFLNGSYGVILRGVGQTGIDLENRNRIENNQFFGQSVTAISLLFQKSPIVAKNQISNEGSASEFSNAAINLNYCYGKLQVIGNKLALEDATLGIALFNCIGTPTERGQIFNNFIQIGGFLQSDGILISSSPYQNCYFNSIHSNGEDPNSRPLSFDHSPYLRLFNNIAYNSTGGLVIWQNSNGNLEASDNNDLITTGSVMAYTSSNNSFINGLTQWTAATGLDSHSVSLNPNFTSAIDLHTTNVLLDGKAQPFAEVTTDIDGQIRNPSNPDIGADEFVSANNDAGVFAILPPDSPFAAGSQAIKLTIFNNGTDTLKSAVIQWSVNGQVQTPYVWNGAIVSGAQLNTPVTIGNYSFQIDSFYSITAWTTLPNNSTDIDLSNDTAQVSNLYAALGGVYTIGGTNPDFPNFTRAVNAMRRGGVIAPVTFNVRNGTYTEQIVLKEFNGIGTTNPVTFQSESGDSSTVKLTFNSTIPNQNYLVKLDSADWFRFKNMSFDATNASYGRIFEISNGASNNIFSNNKFVSIPSNNTNEIIYSNGAKDDNNQFYSNRFVGGQFGIYYSNIPGTGVYEIGTVVENNIFEGQQIRAILVNDQSGIVISKNTVVNSLSSIAGAIQVNSSINQFRITANSINISRGFALYIADCSSQIGNENKVYNNFIKVGNAANQTGHGIYVVNSDRTSITYNNVLITTSNSGSVPFLALNTIFGASTYSLNLFNNIFYNKQGGLAIDIASVNFLTSNYNDLLTTGSILGRFNNVSAANLAAWRTLSAQDLNSISIDPLFVSDADLHVAEIDLNNAGTPISGIADDIDGDLRNPLKPDIGADEFIPVGNHDIGVALILEPNVTTPFPAGLREIKAVLKNHGADTIMNANVQWRVNNQAKTPFAWSGLLAPGARDTVSIGSVDFNIGVKYDLTAFTQSPNGIPDNKPSNDTAKANNLYTALLGTYTIGGVLPNFPSFTAAAAALNNGGILGPVTFNVRNGTYNERFIISAIKGSSTTNQVTFQSESGDNTLVTLTTSSGNMILLSGADNLIFNKLNFYPTGSATSFYLENGVENVKFTNNIFMTYTSSPAHIVSSNSSISTESNIQIDNNYFKRGVYAIYLAGSSSLGNGVTIENNTFENQASRSIYLNDQSAPIIRGNMFTNTTNGYVAITCESCENRLQITENKISASSNFTNNILQFSSCDGTSANRGLIANNFLQVAGSGNVRGISLSSCSYQNIYHNSIHVNNTNTLSQAFYVTSGSNINVQNNIFANTGGGYTTYVTTPTAIGVSNFNDLYATGTFLANWQNVNRTDLTALRTASGKEASSISENPLFFSPTNLHVLQAALDSAASPVLEVSTDIDGQMRTPNYPDIGADEFDYTTTDVGVIALIAPLNACNLSDQTTVTVAIQNYGGLPQTGFAMAYRLNGASPVVENVGAKVVAPGDTIHYTFTQKANLSAFMTHTFSSYSLLAGDLMPSNDSTTAQVINYQTPAQVANMLPADGTQDLSPPVSFSWLPAVGATRYDLFVWKATDPVPSLPVGADISQIVYVYNDPAVVYGATYNWRVVAKNERCQTPGPIQQFTMRQLPDLTVANVSAPASPFSGQSVSVSWRVSNNGTGSTGMDNWFDYIYLSTDPVYQEELDTYLGGASNLTALNNGQTYMQTAMALLPQGIQGNYYIIVITDKGNSVRESNENNNFSSAFPLVINLTPPPDLKVTSIVVPNNAFSGQNINLAWTVKNQGTGDIPAGGQFRDFAYLSTSPSLNFNTAILLGEVANGPIQADSSRIRNLTAKLPAGIFGDYYIHVYTDRFNSIFEFAFEDNNITVSDTFKIFLTPPPDLVVSQVVAPAFVSNNQTISLQWTVENQGATVATGPWTDRILMSKSATYQVDSVRTLLNVQSVGNLLPGDVFNRTASVVIPPDFQGPYYFYVFTDATNQVFEFQSDNNNTGRSNATTNVLNPDLIVTQVEIPDTASSGTSIPVQWMVKNDGMGSVLNRDRRDEIYLSQSRIFSFDASTRIGDLSYGGTLLSGQIINRQANAQIPNGLTGKYYIHVLTDGGNSIFEGSLEGNNSNLDSLQIQLSPWPDLEVVNTSLLPDTIFGGTTLNFSYTVRNTGTLGISGAASWTDRIYISANPTFNVGNSTLLHTSSVLQSVAINGTYTQTAQLAIPQAASGLYYLFVVIDETNLIYEFTDEGNNLFGSTPIYVKALPPVDFELLSVSSLPDTLNSGQNVTLNWAVRNKGSNTDKFGFALWYDGVYLSPDSLWDEYDDVFVKDFTKNGPVDSLESYQNSQSFNLPNGIFGNYYMFIVADHNERTNDEEFDNNPKLVRPLTNPTGPAKPFYVRLSPSPDLTPTTFIAPSNAVSGQPIRVRWTVKNNGLGTLTGTWTDKVYLSTDLNIDNKDRVIGIKPQNLTLLPGQQYTDSLTVTIPVTASGNYVLIFDTDANNVVFEYNAENNNTFFSFLSAVQPLPSDLVVSTLSFPTMAMVGAPFAVTWSIKNQGINPASGFMRELIYFSTDPVLDPADVLLNPPLGRTINLVPNAEASKTFTGVTPGLPLGDYYVIVSTDVQDNILESDESNNYRVSTEKVRVTIQELPIGVLTPNTLKNNKPLYYRIEVPDSLIDETLLITLDGLNANGINELYLSHGQIPTRSTHDYAFGNAFQSDQTILVPELKGGTYYLMAYGAVAGGDTLQNITLKAQIIKFSVLSVMSNEGGNTGNVTLRVDGAKFTSSMVLKLKDATLGTITAHKVIFVNSTRVFATFNLAGASLGVYDVEASRNAETASLPDAFTIIAGDAGTTTSASNGSNGFTCNIVNIGTDQSLSENIQHPASVRVNRLVPITIQYGNAGNVDIPVPARFLISLRGAPLSFTPDGVTEMKQELYLEFQEIGGPPGILRPGSFSSITVYSYSSHPLRFILRE